MICLYEFETIQIRGASEKQRNFVPVNDVFILVEETSKMTSPDVSHPDGPQRITFLLKLEDVFYTFDLKFDIPVPFNVSNF